MAISQVKIHTLNVGQGDCQFIEIFEISPFPPNTKTIKQLILIDAGKNSKTPTDIAKYAYTNFPGKIVDVLIISHWDADHYMGLKDFPQALKTILPRTCTVFYPDLDSSNGDSFLKYEDPVTNTKINYFIQPNYKSILAAQPYVIYSDATIDITIYAANDKRHPFKGNADKLSSPKNRSSIGILLKDKTTGFCYFTGGDLHAEEEKQLASVIDKMPFNQINSFKASHHGSKYSTFPDFVQAIKLTGGLGIAILSHNNVHKHPTSETIATLIGNGFLALSTNKIDRKTDPVGIFDSMAYHLDTTSDAITQEPVLNNFKELIINLTGDIIFQNKKTAINSRPTAKIIKSSVVKLKGDDILLDFMECVKEFNPTLSTDKKQITIEKINPYYPRGFDINNCVIEKNSNKLNFIGEILKEKIKIEGQINDNILVVNSINPIGVIKFEEDFNSLGFSNLELIKLVVPNLNIRKIELVNDFKNNNKSSIKLYSNLDLNFEFTQKLNINNFNIVLETNFETVSIKSDDIDFFNEHYFNNISLTTNILLNDLNLSASLDISELPVTKLSLTSVGGLKLSDIAKFIPDFDSTHITNWLSSLGLNNVNISSVSLRNSFNGGLEFLGLELGLFVDIFKNIKLYLKLYYSKNLKVFSGDISNTPQIKESIISVRSLLQMLNLSNDAINSLPSSLLNLSIENLNFSADLSSNKYRLFIDISTEFEFSFSTKVKLKVSRVILNIEKTPNNNDISILMKANLNGEIDQYDDVDNSNITVYANYISAENTFSMFMELRDFDTKNIENLFDLKLPEFLLPPNINLLKIEINNKKDLLINAEIEFGFQINVLTETFVFRAKEFISDSNNIYLKGEVIFLGILTTFIRTINRNDSLHITAIKIEKIYLADIIELFIKNKELSQKFKLNIDKLEIIFSENRMNITSEIALFQLGDVIKLDQNKLNFNVQKNDISFGISTNNLQINAFNKNLSAKGSLQVSTQGVVFSGEILERIDNIFGINGLNITKFAVSLNQKYSPPSIGVGFMGGLEYSNFKGNTAIYFSPNMPNDMLLAVNFNGLKLSDIVYSILDLKSDGIQNIIESINIDPIILSENYIYNTPISTILNTIIEHDPDNKISDLSCNQYSDKYPWLNPNEYLIINESNFRVYYFSNLSDKPDVNNYSISKYVNLYACLNPQGIYLNNIKFDAGFAFSGNLKFMGVSQIVNFSATPKEGLFLYYEMEEKIKIGQLLVLSRIEDELKGPILSLSTYKQNQHFYLSAKLEILKGLFTFAARILFINNSMSFFLYHQVFGFQSTITAQSSWESFEKANFQLGFSFVTSGFSNITDIIKQEIYNKAEFINNAAKDALDKINLAKSSAELYTTNIESASTKLKTKNRELSDLKNTRYPWYRSYKYIELGIRIIAVGGEIAVLLIYRLAQIALLEAVLIILEVAEKILKEFQKLAPEILKGIADVISGIGKGIDWLISIKEIKAGLQISNTNQHFDFSASYTLIGRDYTNQFELNYNGNLYEQIIKTIRSSLPMLQLSGSTENRLDNLYGQNSRLNCDMYNGKFDYYKVATEVELTKLNRYREVNIHNSLKILNDEFNNFNNPNSIHTNYINNESFKDIESSLSDYLLTLNDESNFADNVKNQTENALDNLSNLLKLELSKSETQLSEEKLSEISQLQYLADLKIEEYKGVIIESKNVRTTNINQTKKILGELNNLSKNSTNYDNSSVLSSTFKTAEASEIKPTIDQAHEIITKYESLVNNPELDTYLKISCYSNIGAGYAELGNMENSKNNFAASLRLSSELLGADSFEYLEVKDLIEYYWPSM